nr:ribonuclease HI [Chitinophagaceae bacterium]
MNIEEKKIHPLHIYTDGASRGNPGNGGYGVVLIWGNKQKELFAGYRFTTNNRMELLAVIVALKSLTKTNIPLTIFTDSKYVVDSVEKKW